MTRLLTPNRVEAAFWTLLCGGLATGIGIETEWGKRWQWPLAKTTVEPIEFRAPILAEPFHLAPPDTFLETSLRPIFVITRRPAPVPPAPEPPKPSMKKDQFVLTGTTVVSEGKFAFLFEKAANKVHVVPEGKEINGIRLRAVTSDRVVLTQHDDEEVLILKPAKPAAFPVPPPSSAENPGPAVTPSPITRPRGRLSPPGDPRPPPAVTPTPQQ